MFSYQRSQPASSQPNQLCSLACVVYQFDGWKWTECSASNSSSQVKDQNLHWFLKIDFPNLSVLETENQQKLGIAKNQTKCIQSLPTNFCFATKLRQKNRTCTRFTSSTTSGSKLKVSATVETSTPADSRMTLKISYFKLKQTLHKLNKDYSWVLCW